MPTMNKTEREEISRRRLRQNWQRKEARAVHWLPEIHFAFKKARQGDLLPEMYFCCQMFETHFFAHSTFVVKLRLYTSALGDKILSSCLLYTCTTRSIMVLLDLGLRGLFII